MQYAYHSEGDAGSVIIAKDYINNDNFTGSIFAILYGYADSDVKNLPTLWKKHVNNSHPTKKQMRNTFDSIKGTSGTIVYITTSKKNGNIYAFIVKHGTYCTMAHLYPINKYVLTRNIRLFPGNHIVISSCGLTKNQIDKELKECPGPSLSSKILCDVASKSKTSMCVLVIHNPDIKIKPHEEKQNLYCTQIQPPKQE